MSFVLKYNGNVVFQGKGQPESIKSCFFNLPREIQKLASQCELELLEETEYKTKAQQRSENLRAVRNKKYYDKIKNDRIQCECGSMVVKTGYKRHLQSKKHKDICATN